MIRRVTEGLSGKWTTAISAAAAIAMGWGVSAGSLAATPPIPTVSGPITGPGAMYSGMRPVPAGTEVEDFGYVTTEYFVSGIAGGQPYQTRILVRQPASLRKFSGIVVAEVMHSNGFAVTFTPARVSLLLRHHIFVEIAGQRTNVETTLKGFSPDRYAALAIPSAAQTSEIIAQVGMLIRGNLRGGPLGDFHARRLVLMGTSQSSGVVRTYLGVHPTLRLPDGGPIYDGFLTVSTLGNTPMPVVDVPMVQMPTQTEANSNAAGGNAYRRPDSDEPGNRFRMYEVAGMPHADSRESTTYVPNPCSLPISDFPWGAMAALGLNHLVRWVDHGIVPPRAPRILTDGDTAGDGSLLALDPNGNARQGVRNVYVDVPVAKYGVPQQAATPAAAFNCSIAGFRLPLPHATLRSLYGDPDDYVRDVKKRLEKLVRDGWFLPEYEGQVVSDAEKLVFEARKDNGRHHDRRDRSHHHHHD